MNSFHMLDLKKNSTSQWDVGMYCAHCSQQQYNGNKGLDASAYT